MRALLHLLYLLPLAACAPGPLPVDRPCGVILDNLGDVQATTSEGNRRIDAHFEAGVAAGCWTRDVLKKGVQ